MQTPKPAQPKPPSFDGSLLKFYSFGYAANNLPMMDPEDPTQICTILKVTPIEHLTMLDGELGSIPVEQEVEGQDANNDSYISKVTSDTAISADWLTGFGISNRRTPPNMRRGERVMLFQYADTDQYYWTDLGLDGHFRKLETSVYSWSGTSDEAVDGTLDGNCYSLEISTHTGQITLKTSKVNGEHCCYALQIDALNGKVQLVDDLDNEFVFDSKETMIRFKNADGSSIELDKKDVIVKAPERILMSAEKSMLFKTEDYRLECNTYRVECQTGSFSGQFTFENQVNFQQATTFTAQITANGGLRSPTVPVYGPTRTLN